MKRRKKSSVSQVSRIVDHLMAHDFCLADKDGKATRWGVWSPDKLNRDPEWSPDRSLNSMELLSFVKLAYYVTQDEKYQREYLRLIKEEGYLTNMDNIPNQDPAWFIYFDVVLAAYQYPILLQCEKDPELLSFYRKHIDRWMEQRKGDQNPLINFIYSFSTNKKAEIGIFRRLVERHASGSRSTGRSITAGEKISVSCIIRCLTNCR